LYQEKDTQEIPPQNTDPVILKLEYGTLFDSGQALPQFSTVLLGSADEILFSGALFALPINIKSDMSFIQERLGTADIGQQPRNKEHVKAFIDLITQLVKSFKHKRKRLFGLTLNFTYLALKILPKKLL
jgi:hypothetical protein